jgi:hypothetical protein
MANALALPMLGVYKKHTNLQNVDFNERNRGQLSPRSGFVQQNAGEGPGYLRGVLGSKWFRKI